MQHNIGRLFCRGRLETSEAANQICQFSIEEARRLGAWALPYAKKEKGLLTLVAMYLVSAFLVFTLHASPLDAPTLVVQEYNESFLTKARFSKGPAAVEHGIEAYLTRNMKGASKLRVMKLTKLVMKLARQHNFHPGLIVSVMRVESGFRSWAVSPRGALGLMQIMPETGQWIAERYGMNWEGPVMLLDEEVNTTMGVRYLAYLRDKYDGDLRKMLSAYNRGPAKVDEEVAEGRDGQLEYYYKVKEYLPKLASVPRKQDVHVD